MKVIIIAAMDKGRVIGKGGELPWRLPSDLKHFKTITTGFPVIMGRKTFESLGRKPLPLRRNIVLTREVTGVVELEDAHTGAHVYSEAGSLNAALDDLRERGFYQAYIIGGGEIYAEALSLADTLVLTEIDASFDGDTYFPPFDRSDWRQVRSERILSDAYPYSIVTYDRKGN